MKIVKGISLLYIVCFNALMLYANAEPLNRILAYVNKDIITQAQFDREYQLARIQLDANKMLAPSEAKLKKDVLDQLINQNLQMQKAKEAGITVNDAMLNKALARIAAQNKMTVAELQKMVQSQGVSYDEYRDNIRMQLTLNKLQQAAVGDQVHVTPQEVKNFLRNYVAENTQYHYQLIDVVVVLPEKPTKAQVAVANNRAKNIATGLKKGEVAEKFAGDDVTINNLGSRTLNDIPSLFSAKIQALAVNGVAGPIRAPNGLHVIKLVAKTADNSVALPTQAEAEQMVYAQKMNTAVSHWLKELRKSAYIQVVQ